TRGVTPPKLVQRKYTRENPDVTTSMENPDVTTSMENPDVTTSMENPDVTTSMENTDGKPSNGNPLVKTRKTFVRNIYQKSWTSVHLHVKLKLRQHAEVWSGKYYARSRLNITYVVKKISRT